MIFMSIYTSSKSNSVLYISKLFLLKIYVNIVYVRNDIQSNHIVSEQNRFILQINDIEVDNWIFGLFPLIYWPRKDKKLLIILKSRLRSLSFIRWIATSFQILYCFSKKQSFLCNIGLSFYIQHDNSQISIKYHYEV